MLKRISDEIKLVTVKSILNNAFSLVDAAPSLELLIRVFKNGLLFIQLLEKKDLMKEIETINIPLN